MSSSKNVELLGIGNAMVDVFGTISQVKLTEILEQAGQDPHKRHVSWETIQALDAHLSQPLRTAGGGAANTVKLVARLGIPSAFVGAVGTSAPAEAAQQPDPSRFLKAPLTGSEKGPWDEGGQLFEQELREAGVETHLVPGEGPTGMCLILSVTNEGASSFEGTETRRGGKNEGPSLLANPLTRSLFSAVGGLFSFLVKNRGLSLPQRIYAFPGAATSLSLQHIPLSLIRFSTVVLVDGYLLSKQELIQEIVQQADKFGTVIAMDVGNTALVQEHAHFIEKLCRERPLMLFMNEEEAHHFCIRLNPRLGTEEHPSEEELYEPLRSLTRHHIFPIIGVKRGAQGALIFAGGEEYHSRTVPRYPRDTTGAGDAFAAGFIGGWLRGKSLAECATLGNQLAGKIIRVYGTKLASHPLREIAKKLR
ncbi:adenosine kinase [Treponema sp. J25]|uniref:adenosine kinase n=1 Tax=Treponema sp. J25 TaxID=2094121 RepID=UPI00105254F1|nr:adenosine kinase [Treponema sp. J25]